MDTMKKTHASLVQVSCQSRASLGASERAAERAPSGRVARCDKIYKIAPLHLRLSFRLAHPSKPSAPKPRAFGMSSG